MAKRFASDFDIAPFFTLTVSSLRYSAVAADVFTIKCIAPRYYVNNLLTTLLKYYHRSPHDRF